MSLEQLQRARGAHLRGDDAHHIVLQRNVVNGRQSIGPLDDSQASAKDLTLLALPVKSDADGHIVQGKSAGPCIEWRQSNLGREPMTSGCIRLPRGVCECPDEFNFDGRARLSQSDSDVHSLEAMSSNMA